MCEDSNDSVARRPNLSTLEAAEQVVLGRVRSELLVAPEHGRLEEATGRQRRRHGAAVGGGGERRRGDVERTELARGDGLGRVEHDGGAARARAR